MKTKPSAINIIWLSMALIATVVAAFNGTMDKVTASMFDSAKNAVTLAIGLIGPMALWLGIMKVVEAGGMLKLIAKALKPIMSRLFPDVPSEHPAMSSMIMNIAANFLGLGNAATPMGIKAMQELDKLNKEKGTATNAMCLFLAINTSSVTFLPLGVITIRASAGVTNPADIFLPTLFATVCSTIAAIIASKLLQRTSPDTAIPFNSQTREISAVISEEKEQSSGFDLTIPSIWQKIFVWGLIGAFLFAVGQKLFLQGIPPVTSPDFMKIFSNWLIPVLMSGLLLFGFFRGVKIYETVTEGAKDGFQVAIKIVPFMVAIFVAIGMFRESGALDVLVWIVKPLTSLIGMPPEALPMAILRPLSGSGAYGYMAEIVTKYPQSFLAYFVSTLQGSTETTFYVLAVYFGSISIRKTRHALAAGLCADAVGILAALFICRIMF